MYFDDCTGSPAPVAKPISIGRFASNALSMLRIWRERARSRRELAARSERELQDIGTCSSSISAEIGKPFWRA
jgi:uncharacterized protein YjiS (DUF1127 family)